MTRRVAIPLLVAGPLGWGVVQLGRSLPWLTPQTWRPPLGRVVELETVAVASGSFDRRTLRKGRVEAVLASPGQLIGPHEPLLEFKDLALLESRASLERKIETLRTEAAAARDERAVRAQAAGDDVRLAALQHLEESHSAARKDLERWRTLFREGLVARLEYERRESEFAALDQRLQSARDTLRQPSAQASFPATGVPAELGRAERLLARLERLQDTFHVSSPSEAVVESIHVQVGEMPERGTPLATLARTVLPRLEAPVDSDARIAAVLSACEVPGPLAFSIRDGFLRVTAPASRIRPGEVCPVSVLYVP